LDILKGIRAVVVLPELDVMLLSQTHPVRPAAFIQFIIGGIGIGFFLNRTVTVTD
jgi:hypothetical protein